MTVPAPDPVLVGWVYLDDITADWATTVTEDDLTDALDAAHAQCLAFLNGREPALGADGRVPARFRTAQTKQARALIRADATGSGDQIGGDGLTVTVFPMDWTVKALLRPKRGRRRVL